VAIWVGPNVALGQSRRIDTASVSRHVRFTSNSVRTLAPQRNDARCQLLTRTPQQTTWAVCIQHDVGSLVFARSCRT
jgi:hypothetical protein